MKRERQRLFMALALAGLTACTSLRPVPVEEIARLPVVRVGETPPQGDYVVFYPAGQPFPAALEAKGSLFAEASTVTVPVRFARDVYLYKYWASHDGKTWRNSHDLFGVELSGGFDVKGGHATIRLEAK